MDYKKLMKEIKKVPPVPERVWYTIEESLTVKKQPWFSLQLVAVTGMCVFLLSIGIIHQAQQSAMEKFVESFSSTNYIYEQCEYSQNIYGGVS